MELGKKIRQLRFKAGLTQEQLAEKLGIGAQSVSKWENAVAMPDITLLPILAEIFGVSIDDLFDLTAEQRFNRIENRMDAEEELPAEIFSEFEDYLKAMLREEKHKSRATELIAYLYWHRMHSYAQKVRRYAKEAIEAAPGKKGCQWMLQMAEGHAAWDWNISNHAQAIAFYKKLAANNPDCPSPLFYLIDNLLADRRADEAEEALQKLGKMKDVDPAVVQVYRAHVALARYDEKTADAIVEDLLKTEPDSFACLFEAAQYYAKKSDYEKAIGLYERSFEKETRRPRFQDELQAIADIYRIKGDDQKAAETCDRIVDLLENEWGMTEETDSEVRRVKEQKAQLLAQTK